ncbi:twitch domain-containing radical SAM protein [Halobacteriovorax sp. JY17]|uniref:twitch domain-containing radical SAM protein n=1 Tax=Halobacteriovorax sp. JY17 TaxID=2014617 RepID=UPI0025BE4D43|nr:twitch domain-containing radical SAM protein [Halobacteriovorax sp. JY17]
MSCTFCPLPWVHLSTHPIGEVTLCCLADSTNSIGSARSKDKTLSLNSNSIDSILNSDSFKKVRLEMLSGNRPSACMGCYKNEDQGTSSRRQEEIIEDYFSFKEARKITKEDGSIPISLKKVELRLGNKCNLKCTTCNPASSSSWTQEYKEISKNTDIQIGVNYTGLRDEMFNWPETQEFWSDLSKYSKDISFININGGEPMLYSKQISFLKYLIDHNLSKNITLEYNINLSLISKDITDLWKEFKKVIVKCSIDDVEARNNFIRYPLSWKKVLDNFEKILRLDVEIIILQTLSVYNFLTFEEVYKKIVLIRKDICYSINVVTEPFFLSPLSIPPEVRKRKIKEVFPLIPFKKHHQLSKLFYNEEHDQKNLRMFQRYNSILLKNRKNNFEKDFKELNEVLVNYLK